MGHGSYSDVFKAIDHRDGTTVAVKRLRVHAYEESDTFLKVCTKTRRTTATPC